MSKIIRCLITILKVGLAFFICLCILSIFIIGYAYPSIHTENNSGSTDWKLADNQLRTNMVEGFSWIKVDSNGFNNEVNENNVDNLIMGSSHMEGYNVNYDENVTYLLNQKDVGYTYNIGISGHTIYCCAKNLEDALEEYRPKRYVIIETDTVNLHITDMKSVMKGTYINPGSSIDRGLKRKLKIYLPAVPMLYNQIKIWKESNLSADTDDGSSMIGYKNTLNKFIERIANICQENNVKCLIFYHPKTEINGLGEIIRYDEDYARLFKECCMSNGIEFIDMTEIFDELYSDKHILAHGFTNTAVGTGHLNKYGHKAIAEAIADFIINDRMVREE